MRRSIGFACTTIFHYVHFKRVASHFGDEAVFIIATPRYTNNRYEKLEEYLKDQGVDYCDPYDIMTGKVKLNAVIAPYYMPVFNFISEDVIRIRMLYGYAKDAWNYADWNQGFDLILAYGPYSQRKLEGFASTVSIGHPRFKGYTLRDEVYDVEGRSISSWLKNSDRQTLLYCPTWGDLSSFGWFKAAIGLLVQEYNLIIKLHHGISLSKDFELNDLDLNRLFVCDESADLFDLFPIVDLVISDYSGAIFDAMLAHKRIVLVNSLSEAIADTGVLNIKKMSNIAGLQDKPQDTSLDIRMRDILPSADKPSELMELVIQSLALPTIDYRDINKELYSHQDEQADVRAYEAIQTYLASKVIPCRDTDSSYIAYQRERLAEFVEANRNQPFVVWGAGDYGQLIISWLIHQGIQVNAIIDSSQDKQGQELHGIRIHMPGEYRLDIEERLIVAFSAQSLQSLVPIGEIEGRHAIIPFQ